MIPLRIPDQSIGRGMDHRCADFRDAPLCPEVLLDGKRR